MNGEPDIRIPRPLAWLFSILFMVLLLIPALCRWLRVDYETPPRQVLQLALLYGLHEGNRQTVIGRNGWLYFRPEIDALTGYGPTAREPDSVAKDPNRAPWTPPKGVILEFARQLRESGVELILVPIPSKAMILPEHLTGKKLDHPLTHPNAEAFFIELRANQIKVIDPAPLFMKLKEDGHDVFLKWDTHWTPQTMEETALLVAEHLRNRPWFESAPGTFRLERSTVQAPGDLLKNLSFPEELETVATRQVLDLETSAPVNIHDPESPIVLLGDSFTNIYSAPTLGWGEHAGFAEHLSRYLNLTLDTIAQNGQGSTGVRETLARRPEALKGKRAVVWAIAARDLMLAESVARETGVEWRRVEFNAVVPVPEGAVVMEAEVIAASAVPADPRNSPYPSTIMTVKYRVIQVRQGSFSAPEVLVLHWGYRDYKLSAESQLKPGDRRVLTLVPYLSKPELFPENKTNTLQEDEMVMYWAETVE